MQYWDVAHICDDVKYCFRCMSFSGIRCFMTSQLEIGSEQYIAIKLVCVTHGYIIIVGGVVFEYEGHFQLDSDKT